MPAGERSDRRFGRCARRGNRHLVDQHVKRLVHNRKRPDGGLIGPQVIHELGLLLVQVHLRNGVLLERELAPFAREVIGVLQRKYDQSGGRLFGKKFL